MLVMSEARSLTPLSEADYDAIAGAVMETARGRWFMSEFAKRNRQADTAQLLTAIGRIERVVGTAAPQHNGPDLREAAALIADLRLDLDRISGRSGEPASGLAARMEAATTAISVAVEQVQEVSWGLREAGAEDASCDNLDRRMTEIHLATASIEETAHRIAKIADTIAMLDSSLKALCDTTQASLPDPIGMPVLLGLDLPPAAPLSAYDDIDIVEIDDQPVSVLAEPQRVSPRPMAELKLHTSQIVSEDVVFEDIEAYAAEPAMPRSSFVAPSPRATSEAGMRAIDAMPVAEKLAYFA